MASINFYANKTNQSGQDYIDHVNGTGLGFFGSTFGVSVPVGSQQDSTWTTNQDGSVTGVKLSNTQWVSTGTDTAAGQVDLEGTTINLNNLPNAYCPLNIRFTHDTAVATQNARVIIYDRSQIENPATGVITYAYEARHPEVEMVSPAANLSHRAASNNQWTVFHPLMDQTQLDLTSSPGPSGLNTSASDGFLNRFDFAGEGLIAADFDEGAEGKFLRHDWYVALSSEPTEIGSKTAYAMYVSVEYL